MVNADYAQNDPTQPDYIKNRPFYEGSASEYVEIAPSTVLTFLDFAGEMGSSGIDVYYTAIPYSDEIHSILTSDIDKVKIVWDGTEYICIPYYKDGYIYVGNFGRLNPELATDTEEPFLIIYGYVDKTNVMVFDLITSGSVETIEHTIAVSVLPKIIKKLDSKFIDFDPIAEYIDNYISEALGGDY